MHSRIIAKTVNRLKQYINAVEGDIRAKELDQQLVVFSRWRLRAEPVIVDTDAQHRHFPERAAEHAMEFCTVRGGVGYARHSSGIESINQAVDCRLDTGGFAAFLDNGIRQPNHVIN